MAEACAERVRPEVARTEDGRRKMDQGTPELPDGLTPWQRLLRRLRLRYLLFGMLLFSGIIPLGILTSRLSAYYQGVLVDQETVLLTTAAQALAEDLSDGMARRGEQLRELGRGVLAKPDYPQVTARLAEPWVVDHLSNFVDYNPEILRLDVLDESGAGPSMRAGELNERVATLLTAAFTEARDEGRVAYRFVVLSEALEPGAVVAVSVPPPAGEGTLILAAVVRLDLKDRADRDAADEEVFLIDRDGTFLWSGGNRPDTPQVELALRESDLIPDFTRRLSLTRSHDLRIDGRVVPTLARVVPVEETGWGVVVHKPAAVAFREVERAVTRVLLASVVLLILALLFAAVAARWLSKPIQRLSETSHEIANGKFDRRVETRGLVGTEIADLAVDFNRMSDYVANYIEQLKQAARENRELFINTTRAFAAAIDAKDPYTRGHSERVARYSREIARFLGLPKDIQEQVWVSAVLHDIGKIGVDDHVLKKQGVLTAEEFEQMKQHPVIGAEIVAPIAELEKMIPGIRWHHEAWNGSGYPDSLRHEQIPLTPRIIAVADTYDAITTNRPYQDAYSARYALETIEGLAGTKFDPKIVTAFLLAVRGGDINLDRGAGKRAEEQREKGPMRAAEGA